MPKLKFFFEGNGFFSDFVSTSIPHEKSNLETSDVIVSDIFPVGIYNKTEIQKKINTYKKSNKIVLIFLISDNSSPFKIPKNVILFRTSLLASKRKENEFVLPYLWECFNEKHTPLGKNNDKPIVGFCGSIKNNLGKRLSTIDAFKKNDNIVPNFILRDQFWGGKPNDKNLLQEFKDNIIESNFTISNRGRGNFSMRFYQTLSLGRIPILINTDMLFPFDDEIDWKKYIITAKSEEELVNNVISWWKTKSHEEILEIESNCRKLFEDYFSFNSFGEKAIEIIKTYKLNFEHQLLEEKSFVKKLKALFKLK